MLVTLTHAEQKAHNVTYETKNSVSVPHQDRMAKLSVMRIPAKEVSCFHPIINSCILCYIEPEDKGMIWAPKSLYIYLQ
jgi:hypothetical protein